MGLLLPWLNLFLDILFFLMQFINEIIFLISLSDSLLLVYSIMLILPSWDESGSVPAGSVFWSRLQRIGFFSSMCGRVHQYDHLGWVLCVL